MLGGIINGVTKDDPILIKIEQLRKQMTETALQKGFSSPESVRISQELDHFINIYQIKRRQ